MKRLRIRSIKRASWLASALICSVMLVKAQTALEGIRAIEVEQYEKAKSIFSQLIQANPAEASNYYYMGDSYLRSDREDSALYFFQKGVSVNPSSPLNYVGLGKMKLYRETGDQAKSDFEKAVSLDPKNLNTVLYIGEAYTAYNKKDLPVAMSYLESAKKLAPKNPDVLIAIGDVYIEQANGSQAIIQYEKALEADPKSAKAWVRIGRLYTRALNYQESKAAFDKAIEIDPQYPPIYRDLGELYFTAKQYEKAIETYKKFVELTDNSLNTQVRYASFLFLSKDYKATSEVISNLLAKDTTNNLVYRLLGYSAYETGDYKTGYEAINKFMARVEPHRILASDYEYLGKLQLKNNKETEAIETLNKAISMDNEKAGEIYGDLGMAYFQMKDYAKASEAYAKKIERSKGNAADYFLYGRALYFNNSLADADSAFSRVTFAKPDFAPAHLYRARINAQLDPETKEALAKPHYERFVELAVADPKKNKKDLVEAYSYLGYYYFLQNDNETSRTNWMKVKELDPENKQAADVLKQLN